MIGRIVGGVALMLAATLAHGGGVSKCRGPDGKLFFTDKGCPGGQHESWNDDVGYGTVEGTAPVVRSSSAPASRSSTPQRSAAPAPPASNGKRNLNYAKRARDGASQ